MAKRFLVCGGCGFIGSNFVESLHRHHPESEIVVLDALTYAGSLDNLGELRNSKQVRFVQADIVRIDEVSQLEGGSFDLAVNFAAETHVDRSLYYTREFVRTNVLGVDALLSFCRKNGVRFLQISTDEVYGPTGEGESFSETAMLNPSSPYAASKASADLQILSAVRTFGQDAAIVRTTNNYGPRQFPEKLIPYFIHLTRQGKPLPVYGDGKQRRSWFHVDDFCAALLRLIDDFPSGEVFNIGASREYVNLDVVSQLTTLLGKNAVIEHVTDRPAHDRRYFIDSSKFEARYGRINERDLEAGLKQTVDWYQANPSIFDRMRSKDATDFHAQHYRSS